MAHPRFATRFPIIHPLTKRNARYGWELSSNLNDIITSKPGGMFNENVVTKNPTPATPPGKPDERSRSTQLFVSNPGRCHPARSPNSPPSFSTPRVASGKLRERKVGSTARKQRRTYPVYPPILPWTRQVPNSPLLIWKPRTPRGDLEALVISFNSVRRQ